MIRIFLVSLAAAAAIWPHAAAAQAATPPNRGVQVGDRWTFDQRDEITGLPTATFTHVVTEISPNEFVVRVTNPGRDTSSTRIYDHDWNLIDRSNFIQETLETPAGTFEAFKIESRRRAIAAADPSKSWEYENTEWYAPQINHWVRRMLLTRRQNRVITSSARNWSPTAASHNAWASAVMPSGTVT
jgi:hypothetical protein